MSKQRRRARPAEGAVRAAQDEPVVPAEVTAERTAGVEPAAASIDAAQDEPAVEAEPGDASAAAVAAACDEPQVEAEPGVGTDAAIEAACDEPAGEAGTAVATRAAVAAAQDEPTRPEEATVAREPAAQDEPAAEGGTDVAAATDVAALVPLEDLAPAIAAASVSRRAFLGFGLALTGGLAGAVALGRLIPVFADAEEPASPIVPAYDPVGRQWTFVVDTGACIGCGLCVVACKEENHLPEEAEYTRTWVERHVTTSDGALYIDSPEAGMNGFPAQSTAPGAGGKTVTASHFQPRLCMQCENPPCTTVCPVGATYRTEDGVILVDSRRCIGCGYCVVACPYGARYLVPAGGDAPNGTPGVADKCTWCYHRISRGAKPACVEVCPVGARQFGDAADPDSDIAKLVRERSPQPLHPEYGTAPRVLYLGPSIEEA